MYERPLESTEAPNSSQLKELLRHLGKTGGIWGPPGKSKASKMVFWWFSGGFLMVFWTFWSTSFLASRCFQVIQDVKTCQNMNKTKLNRIELNRSDRFSFLNCPFWQFQQAWCDIDITDDVWVHYILLDLIVAYFNTLIRLHHVVLTLDFAHTLNSLVFVNNSIQQVSWHVLTLAS